ncbi:hypothetical protein ID866_7825 [Astraeus odoratus]|nr:hypothetical protein ID866_7825 [Astraeus odoratus]
MAPKRKQNAGPGDDTERVKRLKDSSGSGISPLGSTARVDQGQSTSTVPVTKANDKGKGKEIDRAPCHPAGTAASVQVSGPDTSTVGSTHSHPRVTPDSSVPPPEQSRKRPRIRKLAPPRPFPSVPPGRSATAPRSTSSHPSPAEPTCLCVTRKTALAAYIRRCKTAFLDYGAREVRLSAMGAAIPHLALLVGALSTPGVLPYGEDELKVEVYTGSVEVVDEMLSDSEDDDNDESAPKEEFRKRIKSTMNVMLRVGEGTVLPAISGEKRKRKKRMKKNKKGSEDQHSSGERRRVVIQEPEQEDMDES